jgi:hypothetical protein
MGKSIPQSRLTAHSGARNPPQPPPPQRSSTLLSLTVSLLQSSWPLGLQVFVLLLNYWMKFNKIHLGCQGAQPQV